MLETMATDVSKAFRETAHHYRELAICEFKRSTFRGSISSQQWSKVMVVLKKMNNLPPCHCNRCKGKCGQQESPPQMLAIEDVRKEEEEEEPVSEPVEWHRGPCGWWWTPSRTAGIRAPDTSAKVVPVGPGGGVRLFL